MAERTKKSSEQVLKEAKKRWELCVEAEAEMRKAALDDLEFLSGEQWPQEALREREREGRPALVINRLDQFVLHVANGQRQNRVSGKVFPVDSLGRPGHRRCAGRDGARHRAERHLAGGHRL
jgi:hypothetical protein